MASKRPHPNVFGDEDQSSASLRQGPDSTTAGHHARPDAHGQEPKRARTTLSMLEGSISVPSNASRKTAESVPPTSAIQAQIAAARAKIDAQMAAIRSKQPQQTQVTAPSSTASSPLPLSAPKFGSSALSPSSGPFSAVSGSNVNMENIRKQIAEAKAKAAALSALQSKKSSSLAIPSTGSHTPNDKPSGIHPLLMQNSAAPVLRQSRQAPIGSRAQGGSSSKPTGTVAPPKANPYLSEDAGAADAQNTASGSVKGRSMHRQLQFNRAGRHVRAAEEARREAKLEALKRRIAESARKAGLHEELTGEERRIKRQPPPDVEWWDASLLPQGTYDCVPSYPPPKQVLAEAVNNKPREVSDAEESQPPLPLVLSEGTPIDPYIQHPIPIPDPTEKFKVAPKGVMLTKQEMKKMRRQRRAAERQDKEDRIKMGLQAPDPPKVKLSNLMRVLTSEQVADPTKIEAKVRREVAARREQHERTNAERALTDDQRRAKAAQKKEQDEAKGLLVAVYKIKHLVSPSHKFKVRKNALQDGLTGLIVFHPDFALVIVEGASKGMKHYKKLMLHRIRWDDPGRPREDVESDAESHRPTFLGPMGDAPPIHQESELLENLEWSQNTCELIFEGPSRERFVPSGMRARTATNDYEAREILGTQWAGFWDVARRLQSAKEELL